MKKAPSTILATAGITVGLLGFALPASASTAVHHPNSAPLPVITTHTADPHKSSPAPWPVHTTPAPIHTTTAPQPPQYGHTPPKKDHTPPPQYGHTPPKKGRTSKQVCHRVPVTPKKTPSWEKPKTVYTVKCTPVKKAPVPPKHHKAPKKTGFWRSIF